MRRTLPAALAFVLLGAGSAWAHHNMSAMFDFNQVVMRTGTLAELDWRNPHIYILVDVENAGAVERWSIRRTAARLLSQSQRRQADVRGFHRQERHRRSQPRSQRFDCRA